MSRVNDGGGGDQHERRIAVPGDTAKRMIDLSTSSEPPRYRLLMAHVQGKASATAPVLFEQRETSNQFVAVTGCPDCPGVPMTAPSAPPGFDRAVVLEHAESCPSMRAALAEGGTP